MRFPDVEAMVLTFLRGRVESPMATTVPSPRPDPFVRLWRNGGPAVNRVLERAQVTVEAWSADSVTASEIASACREALLNEYYDPMYVYQRESKVARIEFAGEHDAVLAYLRDRASRSKA